MKDLSSLKSFNSFTPNHMARPATRAIEKLLEHIVNCFGMLKIARAHCKLLRHVELLGILQIALVNLLGQTRRTGVSIGYSRKPIWNENSINEVKSA